MFELVDELLVDDPVVGADGDGGEVDLPHGVVGLVEAGDGGRVQPLLVAGRDEHAAQHDAQDQQQDPENAVER